MDELPADIDRRRLTLTFDNGPSPAVTDHVLDVLGAHRALAIFFVIGTKFDTIEGRALTDRARQEGHLIGNHTWSHSTPLGALDSIEAVDAEIDRAQAALGDLVEPQRLFRPYGSGGVIDDRLIGRHGRQRLLDGGFTCSLWNCLPRDWLDPDGWVETALATVRRQPWSVVVLHDVPTGAMAHLDRFLEHARAGGVELSQDLPDVCTPIRLGVPTASFAMLPVP